MSASTQSPTLCVPQRMGHPGSSFYSSVNTASGIIDARYPKEKNTAKGCATRPATFQQAAKGAAIVGTGVLLWHILEGIAIAGAPLGF